MVFIMQMKVSQKDLSFFDGLSVDVFQNQKQFSSQIHKLLGFSQGNLPLTST